MPFPSETRRALLEEHARLRVLLAELEDLAERTRAGDDPGRRFGAVAGQLLRALEVHNEAEERVLAPLLRLTDAWGPERIGEMTQEHAAEHVALRAALAEPEHAALARKVPELAKELRIHMAREEATFLAPEVLTDDVVTDGPDE